MKKLQLFLLAITLLGFSYGSIAQNVNIPDPKFKEIMIYFLQIDDSIGEISVAEAAAFPGVFNDGMLDIRSSGISDLTGIEAFTSINVLYCQNNNLTSLDVSANRALTQLDCSNNHLTSLNVANTSLTWLDCQYNLLTSLDVSADKSLSALSCWNNQISYLDLSFNTALTSLGCNNNSLTSLEVSKNMALTQLDCSKNLLTSIDISANTALEGLICSYNQLLSLDVSANKALWGLWCTDNRLINLDVSANKALTYFDCSFNSLNSLNMKNGNNTKLGGGNFSAINNPYLKCIEVDDPVFSKQFWQLIDTQASYSNSCSTSDIKVTNEIANNPSFSKPYILWRGNSSQNAPTIKICADGSNATKIYFKNNTGINSNNIRFQIESDPNATDKDLYGFFEITSVSGNDVSAKLNHPEYLPSNYKPSRSDAILIVDVNAAETPIVRIPIEIYRAPVIMVHGIWADETTFKKLNSEIVSNGLYPYEITKRADYSGTNSNRFWTNRGVVPECINTCLTQCRMYDYSAGKVDVIGHSMGGILSRYYLQSLFYKNDIHKLITLNTPHSGSQGANLIENYGSDFIRIFLNFLGKPTNNGAVDDLRVNSDAILATLNGLYINNHKVPSHAIITRSPYLDDVSWAGAVIKLETLQYKYQNPNDFLSDLYREPNDLVVGISSQQGGLPNWACTNIPGSQIHNGSSDNKDVINKVEFLLCVNPNFEVPFSKDGYDPVILTSVYKKSAANTNLQQGSGTVTIISPAQNANYNSGSVIPITVSATGTIKRIFYAASNKTSDIRFADSLSSYVTFYDTIPSNVLGVRKIIAMGFDSTGIVALDSTYVNITTNATLDSISLYGNAIYVEKNKTSTVAVTAYYNNGYSYNINSLPEVQFHLDDINIAEYVNSNLIQGKDTGSTVLTVSYLNKTKSIPVVVIPEDTTNIDIINSIPENQNSKGSLSSNGVLNIDIYPNPANYGITIDLGSYDPNSNTSLQLFSVDGRLLKTQIIQQDKTLLSIAGFTAGIYILKVTDDKRSAVRRVIKE